MRIPRLALLIALAATPVASQSLPPVPHVPGPDEAIVIAKGPFAPTFDSLAQYRCPDWFRDAKLGFWAHWGPQSVPMFGDWYARQMYRQGHKQYQDHLERYGHPSKSGWKDVIPLWKAEKWDPAGLMALYKKAGARYFVSMGVHHDNFDLWDSKYHRWNAVNMGPHRDVVGEWQKAAKAAGLPFGVSEHLGASFTWWQESHGSDKTGPLAGVPYDGADPRWQDLYHPLAAPGDTEWYSTDPGVAPRVVRADPGPRGPLPARPALHGRPGAVRQRDGAQPHRAPLQQLGRPARRPARGRLHLQAGVEGDVGAGRRARRAEGDQRAPVADGHVDRRLVLQPRVEVPAGSWMIHMLVDVVSKNGNLLINIVQRPDGTLDPEVQAMLVQMADWIAVNGEAIYGTRPWTTFGEGPVRAEGGAFKEDAAFTAEDVRFTTKGDTLYAFVLGWPERPLTIRALGTAAGHVTAVRLLGHDGALQWRQEAGGLTISPPATAPCDDAFAFAIIGVLPSAPRPK